MNDVIKAEEDATFASWVGKVNTGFGALNEAADVGAVSELLAPDNVISLETEVWAHLLMNMLGQCEGPLTLANKQFLVELSAALGPDWLEQLRKAAAFMIKVDGFN